MARIKGKWKLKDTLNAPGADIEQAVSFESAITSLGKTHTVDGSNLLVDVASGRFGLTYTYTVPSLSTDAQIITPYTSSVGWDTTDYAGLQTVDFGDTEQEVSAEFYSWFTQNATEVSPSGGTVLRAGTYRFNDVLTAKDGADLRQDIDFYVVFSGADFGVDFSVKVHCSQMHIFWQYYNTDFNWLFYNVTHIEPSQVEIDGTIYDIADALLLDVPGENAAHKDSWNVFLYQTITLPTDQDVSTEFYEWFMQNTVEQKQISGVWRFKENGITIFKSPFEYGFEYVQPINFTCKIKLFPDSAEYIGFEYLAASCSGIRVADYKSADTNVEVPNVYYFVESTMPSVEDPAIVLPAYLWLYRENGDFTDGYWGVFGENENIIDFGTEPQYVSIDFYNWLIENATQPSATVTYNGSTIATLFGGQTATLKCEGMRMESDVVVKVEEQGSADKAAQFFAENFPSDVWGDGEYTGSIMSVPVTMRYKYRLDRDDPKDIPFVGMIESDEADFEATENLADWYLKTAMLQCGRIQATYESGMSQIIYLNPVVPTYYDLSQLFSAQLGMGVKAVLNATQCGVRNYEGVTNIGANDTVVNFSAETDLDPEALVGLPITALLWQLSIQLRWHHDSFWAYGGQGELSYLESKHVITENGSYDWYKYINGYTGVRSVAVNVPEQEPVLQEKTVTENGEVVPDEGYDGLSKVTVAVESSGGGGIVLSAVNPTVSLATNIPVGSITASMTVALKDISDLSVTEGE